MLFAGTQAITFDGTMFSAAADACPYPCMASCWKKLFGLFILTADSYEINFEHCELRLIV